MLACLENHVQLALDIMHEILALFVALGYLLTTNALNSSVASNLSRFKIISGFGTGGFDSLLNVFVHFRSREIRQHNIWLIDSCGFDITNACLVSMVLAVIFQIQILCSSTYRALTTCAQMYTIKIRGKVSLQLCAILWSRNKPRGLFHRRQLLQDLLEECSPAANPIWGVT